MGNGRIVYCWPKIWQIFSHGPPGRKESSAQTISGRVAIIIHPFRRRLWAKSFIQMNQMSGANTSTLTTLPTFWDVEEDTEDTRVLTHTLIIDILLSYELWSLNLLLQTMWHLSFSDRFIRGALTVGCDSRKSGRTQSYSKKITHTQSILVYILGTEISCHRRMEPWEKQCQCLWHFIFRMAWNIPTGKRLQKYGKSPSLRTVSQLFLWAILNSKL